jgi:hypothetical protein
LTDQTIALSNREKHQLGAVSIADTASNAARIRFVSQFLFLRREEVLAEPRFRNAIFDALQHLMPGKPIALPHILQAISRDSSCLYDAATAWKMQDLSPPPLNSAILAVPAPKKDAPPRIREDISTLHELYEIIMTEPKKPEGGLFAWFRKPIDWLFWKPSPEQLILIAMTAEIIANQHNIKYATAKTKIESIMAQCRDGTIPLDKRRSALIELLKVAPYCANQWAMESERQDNKLKAKDTTLADRFWNWKADFIEQSIIEFLHLKLTPQQDAQNTHFLAGVYFKWGHLLGKRELPSQKKAVPDSISIDSYRVDTLDFSWEELDAFLQRGWNDNIIDALKTQIDLSTSTAEVAHFLSQAVERKLPSVDDSDQFVVREYYEMQNLNNRAITRFLREILTALPPLQVPHS